MCVLFFNVICVPNDKQNSLLCDTKRLVHFVLSRNNIFSYIYQEKHGYGQLNSLSLKIKYTKQHFLINLAIWTFTMDILLIIRVNRKPHFVNQIFVVVDKHQFLHACTYWILLPLLLLYVWTSRVWVIFYLIHSTDDAFDCAQYYNYFIQITCWLWLSQSRTLNPVRWSHSNDKKFNYFWDSVNLTLCQSVCHIQLPSIFFWISQ